MESKLLYLFDVSQELKDKVRDLCASGNNTEVDDSSFSNYVEQINDLENQVEKYKSKIRETNAEMLKLKAVNDNLNNENTELKCKIKDKENELSAVESNLSEVIDKNDSLEKENREVESKLAQLKNKYETPENLIKKYRMLSNTIRLGLSDIVCDKNEVLFITSCTSSEHLKAIWVYTKKLAATDGNADG
ncbi:MAG: hypothetical protein Q4D76_19565, partial [Oscillospiraceae bacterium]|nr:hypothetical protein [Oscillospiraceae bacterium]